MSDDTTPMTATQRLDRLLAMPEVAAQGGAAVPRDLMLDALRESGVDPSQVVVVFEALSADEIKARMARGGRRMCWYCHWGWPKRVALIYKEALERLGGDTGPLHFGPAHVVWADANFQLAESCQTDFDQYADDLTDDEKVIVRWSLEQLAKIPLSERDPAQDEWHNNAAPYPPPKGMEMISHKEMRGWESEFRPKTGRGVG